MQDTQTYDIEEIMAMLPPTNKSKEILETPSPKDKDAEPLITPPKACYLDNMNLN